jgi:hypothetical protein
MAGRYKSSGLGFYVNIDDAAPSRGRRSDFADTSIAAKDRTMMQSATITHHELYVNGRVSQKQYAVGTSSYSFATSYGRASRLNGLSYPSGMAVTSADLKNLTTPKAIKNRSPGPSCKSRPEPNSHFSA